MKLVPVKIKSIRKNNNKHSVYNLHIKNYENYTINNAIVHNCQNWTVSQVNREKDSKSFRPKELVELAMSKGCDSVCYTYNEPTVYFEYIIDLYKECKKNNIKFVIKTNGFLNESPWSFICDHVDAMNIDWKGYDSKSLGVFDGFENIILNNIKIASEKNVHIEISMPVYYDSKISDFENIREYLCKINKDIPIHLLKIFPANKIDNCQVTSSILVKKIYNFMKDKMNNVYIHGDFSDEIKKYRNTYCKYCNKCIVEREKNSIIVNKCNCI